MSVVSVQVNGLRELQRKLEELPKNVARRILRTSLKRVSETLKNDMAEMAPKNSGFLAEHFNVKVTIHNNGLSATAYTGPMSRMYYGGVTYHKGIKVSTGRFSTKGGATPVVSVGRFQEFGTKGKHPTPATHFMKRAFEQWKSWGLGQLIEEIKSEIADATR